MAIFKDVVVNIQRLTAALDSASTSMCLILTTASTKAYKEYSDISAVAVDYISSTEAYKAANALFSQEPKPAKVAIVGITVPESGTFADVIDDLNGVYAAHSDFNYLVTDQTLEANLTALAGWATSHKVFYVATIPVNAVGTIANPESDYVVYIVHDVKAQYADAALVGKLSTYEPGSATWMFKTLNGITPVVYDDQATMVGLINDEHFMTYVKKYGVNMTTGGYLTSGEYVDVMLGVQWIQQEMELRIQSLFLNTAKVPYDNGGIALIAAEVDATLRVATSMGIIRKGEGGLGEYEITIPDISEIATNDIANRELNDISWTAYLAGAIHHVQISGVVQY